MPTGCPGETRGLGPQPATGHRHDEGTATAEFAVVMPAVVFLIIVLTGAAAIGFTQLRAFDAARSGAREIARGEPPAAVIAEAEKHAGAESAVTISSEGGYSTVRVSIRLPPAILVLDHVEAEAVARTEGGRAQGGSP